MVRKSHKNPHKITSFYIDESILHEFDEMCEREDKNRSRVANKIIHNFMTEHKKRK